MKILLRISDEFLGKKGVGTMYFTLSVSISLSVFLTLFLSVSLSFTISNIKVLLPAFVSWTIYCLIYSFYSFFSEIIKNDLHKNNIIGWLKSIFYHSFFGTYVLNIVIGIHVWLTPPKSLDEYSWLKHDVITLAVNAWRLRYHTGVK